MQKSESDVIFTYNGKSERISREQAKRKIRKLRLPPDVEYSLDFALRGMDFSLKFDETEIRVHPVSEIRKIENMKSRIYAEMPKFGIYEHTRV